MVEIGAIPTKGYFLGQKRATRGYGSKNPYEWGYFPGRQNVIFEGTKTTKDYDFTRIPDHDQDGR